MSSRRKRTRTDPVTGVITERRRRRPARRSTTTRPSGRFGRSRRKVANLGARARRLVRELETAELGTTSDAIERELDRIAYRQRELRSRLTTTRGGHHG